MTRRAVAVLAAVIAVVVPAGCTDSAGPGKTDPATTQAPTTTIARRITKLTGGEGEKFCSAFNDATAMLAVATAASLGSPEIMIENELIAAPALFAQLDTMAGSTPSETSGGVRRWRDRTQDAIDALIDSGVTEQQITELTQQVLGLTVDTVDRGRLVDQITANIPTDKLATAATSFGKDREPLEQFIDKLNGTLGGELVGQAKERALQQFPCLAALDAGSDGSPTPAA
jgi:hypothetical protein